MIASTWRVLRSSWGQRSNPSQATLTRACMWQNTTVSLQKTRNLNKHALTNYRRLLGSVTHHFWGGGVLFSLWVFSSLFWNYEELYKSSDIFLFFNWWRKTEKKKWTFFVPLFALCADWTFRCTNCWFLKMFSGERGQGRRKKKGRNPKKRRILVNTRTCLQFSDSWLYCISTSPWLFIRFLSLKSLLLICAKCLMLRDH